MSDIKSFPYYGSFGLLFDNSHEFFKDFAYSCVNTKVNNSDLYPAYFISERVGQIDSYSPVYQDYLLSCVLVKKNLPNFSNSSFSGGITSYLRYHYSYDETGKKIINIDKTSVNDSERAGEVLRDYLNNTKDFNIFNSAYFNYNYCYSNFPDLTFQQDKTYSYFTSSVCMDILSDTSSEVVSSGSGGTTNVDVDFPFTTSMFMIIPILLGVIIFMLFFKWTYPNRGGKQLK